MTWLSGGTVLRFHGFAVLNACIIGYNQMMPCKFDNNRTEGKKRAARVPRCPTLAQNVPF